MLKIIHIITSLDQGGAEKTLYRLVNASIDKFDHHVIVLKSEGIYGPRLKKLGISVTALNMPTGRVTFSGLKKLHSILKNEREALVQTWLYHSDLLGGIFAKLNRVKAIIWSLRNAHVHEASKFTSVIVYFCAKISGIIPTLQISCSHYALDVHRKIGYKCNAIVIPNGLDLNSYKPDNEKRNNFRHANCIGPDAFLVGMVARYDPQKDHESLLTGFAKFTNTIYSNSNTKEANSGFGAGPEIKMALIGNKCDNDNNQLLKLIAQLELTDRILLMGSRDDIPDVLAAIDVHALTSLSEAFPNVLAESMACGTPCVSTNVGDAEIILGQHGYLCPTRDSELFAQKLQEAYRDFQDRDAWRLKQENCRKHIQSNFSIDKMVDQYSATWNSLST